MIRLQNFLPKMQIFIHHVMNASKKGRL